MSKALILPVFVPIGQEKGRFMRFHLIAALDKNRGIGKNGAMPWSLKSELKHFKTLTTQAKEGKQNVVIMGRKTWESLPQSVKPLPGRLNVVVSRQQYLVPPSVHVAHSFQGALQWLNQEKERLGIDRVFVMGGGQLYQEAIGHECVGKLYLTVIQEAWECDTWFPEFKHRFSLLECSQPVEENGVVYRFETWHAV